MACLRTRRRANPKGPSLKLARFVNATPITDKSQSHEWFGLGLIEY